MLPVLPVPTVLFPADPLRPHRPDPHYGAEARCVAALGGASAVVDHDVLTAGGDAAEAVRRVPAGRGPVWYRGWMLPPAAYETLESALAERGRTLLTPAAAYARAHELPGWYPYFAGHTPPSAWLPGTGMPDGAALAEAAERLGGSGPAVVKDYVKSRKREWAEACYVPDLADRAGLRRVVGRFVELQGEFLAGGVVLRRFERFVRDADGRAEEARVWWVDGAPVLVGPHPDTPDVRPVPDLAAVRPLVRALGCRFVTTDLARAVGDGEGDTDDTDGAWRVVEAGDGQVSDLPRGVDASGLFAALLAAPETLSGRRS
ncbi:ATP-grasp domain-containing protein [Streptomyces sp. SKN60]|uniref:ATP-grasp domain-containing protein n=1 Tax=Streptomyces sp. SKN60 TaxID=2855506 RepID=UPI00224781B4|nr:ATP-grasp domain-containing protein [Streptomyces sp. SKN60]